jgi:hypothetical protein
MTSALGEEARVFKVQYLTAKYVRRCGGHKRESRAFCPGRSVGNLGLRFCKSSRAAKRGQLIFAFLYLRNFVMGFLL